MNSNIHLVGLIPYSPRSESLPFFSDIDCSLMCLFTLLHFYGFECLPQSLMLPEHHSTKMLLTVALTFRNICICTHQQLYPVNQ